MNVHILCLGAQVPTFLLHIFHQDLGHRIFTFSRGCQATFQITNLFLNFITV